MIKIFVVDTNILISAHLLPASVSRKAFDMAREIGIAVYSDSTLVEFRETFLRSKFDKYLTVGARREAITAFEKQAQHISVSVSIDLCRDPKDNKFLELAYEAGAVCIITGDQDLLVLNPFEGISILTAAGFLQKFNNS